MMAGKDDPTVRFARQNSHGPVPGFSKAGNTEDVCRGQSPDSFFG